MDGSIEDALGHLECAKAGDMLVYIYEKLLKQGEKITLKLLDGKAVWMSFPDNYDVSIQAHKHMFSVYCWSADRKEFSYKDLLKVAAHDFPEILSVVLAHRWGR